MRLYKILIVCLDSDVLNSVKNCFKEQESYYLFYDATSARTAFRMVFEFHPDLIVLDNDIPELDSLALVKSMKEHEQASHIPTMVLVDQFFETEQIQTFSDLGVIDCIKKPVNEVEIISKTRLIFMLFDTFKHELVLKDRELTNTAMQIARNKEFSANIYEKIKKLTEEYGDLDPNFGDILAELKNELSEKQKVESWNQFDLYIKKIHPDFFNRLTIQCPTITSSELRLAAFLKLNIGTKDIASILFLTVDSVRTARTRLRKKLKIKREENLSAYLSKL